MTDEPYKKQEFRRPDWRWLLILGALLAVGGIMALINPFAASLTAAAIAGAVVGLAGIIHLWLAFQDVEFGAGSVGTALLGLALMIFGVALLANPMAGIVSLTLIVAGFFMLIGVLRVWIAMQLRGHSGWGWFMTSGVISIVLGLLILIAMSDAPASVLGILLGIELLSSGIGAAALAWRLR
ncbi:hypothetical protein GCM10011415_17680 [Salipiger pallidus]|uniref:Acid-resistance membrane protein n=1 Tax=Salipiger pallidus TaxID=1775170 RepID=A0A8J3EGF9_9RHOB|nr:DUF308 domain-containing protein [Salipiger pallidus]GGG70520.1 hypothetical protein GCM10011415_17680 [Salipiger pallidus]